MKPWLFAGESMTLSRFHLNGLSCGVTRWGKFAHTIVPVGGGEFPLRHEIPAFGWKRVPGLPALPAAAIKGVGPSIVAPLAPVVLAPCRRCAGRLGRAGESVRENVQRLNLKGGRDEF